MSQNFNLLLPSDLIVHFRHFVVVISFFVKGIFTIILVKFFAYYKSVIAGSLKFKEILRYTE